MGIWIEYEELYNPYGGPLAENSPPNSAVGVILAVMGIGSALYFLRRSLRLVTAELVVIYAALVLAAPLMTQGMWHRLYGLVAAIPHNGDFKSYQSLPPMLWPHGPNLCTNGQFRSDLAGFTLSGGSVSWTNLNRGSKGIWRTPVLGNANNTESNATCRLAFTLDRFDARGREVLVPGENYLLSLLVKTVGFTRGSAYHLRMSTVPGSETVLLASMQETSPSLALPEGFQRVGVNAVIIPSTLDRQLTIEIGFVGQGGLMVQDIQFFNVQAVEGLYAGRNFVKESGLDKLDASERDFLRVRPDNMFSLAGVRYLLSGHIPLGQWVQPLLAWGTLVVALFLGFLGLNILMRKQWVENERFTFPLTILPKNLFAMENGRLAIFRNWIMWLGFACTIPFVLAKGINFYIPQFPAFGASPEAVRFDAYFTDPVIKAYLKDVGIGVGMGGIGFSFCLLAIALLIETDILLALWSAFLIFQLWNLCGTIFNATRYPGYPWESQQSMGGFIAYALLAVVIGRLHLWQALRSAFGRKNTLEDGQEVTTYRTAFLMVLLSLGLFVGWGIWTRMGALASLLFFGYMLLCGFAASKIRAEMGAPYSYLTPYWGMQFVGVLGGFAVFQSTGMLVAFIAACFICPTCFLLMAPAQVEMMELGRHFKVRPRDVGAGLTLGLLGGLLIGGFVFLCWAYGFGANNLKTPFFYDQNWAFQQGFRAGEMAADRAMVAGTLHTNPDLQPFNFVRNVDAKGLGIGAAITGVLAFLRAKLAWFPMHPLGYVLASSFFMKGCWFTLFVAWVVRLIMFRVGGAHSIRRGLIPFCIGMFLACIASIVVFDVVGVCMRLQGSETVYSKIP